MADESGRDSGRGSVQDPARDAWLERDRDKGAHRDCYTDYEKESSAAAASLRFGAIQDTLLRLVGRQHQPLNVADIGCGAGTRCRQWARQGHHVFGADINAALIGLARQRAAEARLEIRFEVASATDLPWDDQSMDLCIAPELLEHVADWQGCLRELVRVLKPGGALFLSTGNRLCRMQDEFTLPLYSWYPGFIKRRVERRARATRPELAGDATHLAINWFTYYGLRDYLAQKGFSCMDRFDMIDLERQGQVGKSVVRLIRKVPALRFLGHVATSYTVLLGVKARV